MIDRELPLGPPKCPSRPSSSTRSDYISDVSVRRHRQGTLPIGFRTARGTASTSKHTTGLRDARDARDAGNAVVGPEI